VALAHLPVPLLLAHVGATAGETGLAFALVAAADLAVWVLLSGRVPDARAAVVVGGTASAAVATLVGGAAAVLQGQTAGVLSLLALAAVSGAAALVAVSHVRLLLAALPAPLVAAAAFGFGADRLTDVQQPLVLGAVALVAMQIAALLPRSWRDGPVAGAVVVAGAGVATQLEVLAQAALLPFAWLTEPWTRVTVRDARHSLAPHEAWDGTVVTLVVVVCAAVATAGAGLALHRLRTAAAPTAVLLVVAAAVLPLGLATSYPLAVVLLLATTVGVLTVGAALPRFELPAYGAGLALTLLTVAWSLADRGTTLLALGAVTLAFAAVATRRGEATAIACLAAGGFVGAAGAARGLSTDQAGALLLVVPAVAVGLTFVLGGVRRAAAELGAAVVALAAVVLASTDVGWLSWVLALTGLLALVDALHADRRTVAAAGALLLSASSWVRLADAGVVAPEPYVVPLGLVALALGWLRLRREPATRSFAAYGPGLSLLLLPSLLASLDDASLTRPLLLGAAALAVLLVGSALRLQAPIVLGGAVLAVDALQLLAPYAAALPRWMTLGAAGVLLVAVGATYEQRRRDVTALRERFDALA
jgi:hypothetical protein